LRTMDFSPNFDRPWRLKSTLAKLDAVAAGAARRTGVSHADVAPLQVGGEVGVVPAVCPQLAQVSQLIVRRSSCSVFGSTDVWGLCRRGRGAKHRQATLRQQRTTFDGSSDESYGTHMRSGIARCGSKRTATATAPAREASCSAPGSLES
jgi:hypothetical protein